MKSTIIYIGTSPSIIDAIKSYNNFELNTVICEQKRVTKEYEEKVNKYKLNLLTFQSKSEFVSIIEESKEEIALIYQLDLIIPHVLTAKFQMFNFHSGSVKTNRGAHPILRTILNNEKKSEFTLHKINGKIDQGTLISKYNIEVNSSDDVNDIKFKMEQGFETMFDDLILYFEGKLTVQSIEDGKYYKPVSEKDYTIDYVSDSMILIKNKIRSQKLYNGAILIHNNHKFYVKELFDQKNISSKVPQIKIINDIAFIERANIAFKLKLEKFNGVD